METWKNNHEDGIEESQHFLESKKITSFQAVKEFFKNVFFDFIDEVDSSKASIIEKNHELSFYVGDLSMVVINQEDNITIWRVNSSEKKIMAILDFESGHSLIKYVNPVSISYLCEDEIEKVFELAFHRLAVIH